MESVTTKWIAKILPELMMLHREHKHNLNKQEKPFYDKKAWEEISCVLHETMSEKITMLF